MDRRDLLKNTCAVGMCSCLGAWPTVSAAEDGQEDKLAQWQIEFMRVRLENLLEIVTTTLDEATQARVLAQLGRECGKQVVKGYEGNPDGFWAHIKTLWLERVEYDKDKGIIHLIEKPRTRCNCPLAALIKVPKNMCSCSIGTQEGIYEALFHRPAKATVDESILNGGKRCSFTITLQQEEGEGKGAAQ
jgi:hypothetical protein